MKYMQFSIYYQLEMKKKLLIFGLLYSTSLLSIAQQQIDSTKIQQLDEVVVTNSKFELKRENSGKVITLKFLKTNYSNSKERVLQKLLIILLELKLMEQKVMLDKV